MDSGFSGLRPEPWNDSVVRAFAEHWNDSAGEFICRRISMPSRTAPWKRRRERLPWFWAHWA